jgi:hypothetical protein
LRTKDLSRTALPASRADERFWSLTNNHLDFVYKE